MDFIYLWITNINHSSVPEKQKGPSLNLQKRGFGTELLKTTFYKFLFIIILVTTEIF